MEAIPANPRITETAAQDAPLDLESIRKSRGVSMTDLFHRTRISPAMLEAIEKGDFDRLPAPIYARAFLRTYARFLEIDSRPLVSRYERHLQKAASPKRPAEGPASLVFAKHRVLWILLTALVVTGTILFTLLSFDGDREAYPPRQEASGPSAPAPTAPSAPGGQAVPANPPSATEKAGGPDSPADRPGHLLIRAMERTWLRIREEDRPSYQVLLQPGEILERTAPRFALDIGNAGGIEITFEGKSVPNLGKRGQVAHLTLP